MLPRICNNSRSKDPTQTRVTGVSNHLYYCQEFPEGVVIGGSGYALPKVDKITFLKNDGMIFGYPDEVLHIAILDAIDALDTDDPHKLGTCHADWFEVHHDLFEDGSVKEVIQKCLVSMPEYVAWVELEHTLSFIGTQLDCIVNGYTVRLTSHHMALIDEYEIGDYMEEPFSADLLTHVIIDEDVVTDDEGGDYSEEDEEDEEEEEEEDEEEDDDYEDSSSESEEEDDDVGCTSKRGRLNDLLKDAIKIMSSDTSTSKEYTRLVREVTSRLENLPTSFRRKGKMYAVTKSVEHHPIRGVVGISPSRAKRFCKSVFVIDDECEDEDADVGDPDGVYYFNPETFTFYPEGFESECVLCDFNAVQDHYFGK